MRIAGCLLKLLGLQVQKRRLNLTRVSLPCIFSLIALSISYPANADALSDRNAFWKERAFLCEAGAVKFPSKYSSTDPSHCDDGDMTLFNGLLCSSGEQSGCDAVALSQEHSGKDKGRWWRSPRRVGWEYSNGQHDVSFSPDQALGVLHYIVRTGNVSAFDEWTSWIQSHRQSVTPKQVETLFAKANLPPLVMGLVTAVIVSLPPHPTYCTDDYDLRCALRPGDCELINKVGASFDRKPNICSGYAFFDAVAAIVKSAGLSLPDLLSAGGSHFNDADYPLHLASVQIFLLKRLGDKSIILNEASNNLAEREKVNPFFNYLADRLPHAQESTLTECPTKENPSKGEPQEWAWERPDSSKKWLSSMYWDCIFMANLLQPAH